MLRCEFQGSTAICDIDVGKVNALGRLDIDDWENIISRVDAAFPQIRLLVIRSNKTSPGGYPIFCAGANQKERSEWSRADILAHVERQRMAIHRLRQTAVCSVAWVDGLALGLGTEICLACDFVCASPRAQFGFPERDWGIIPGAGGSAWAHGWAEHPDAAQEYIQKGLRFDRDAAFWLGIVDVRCECDEFDTEFAYIRSEIEYLSPEEQANRKKSYHEKIDYRKWFSWEQSAYAEQLKL